jgi:hypothetical protein
MATNDVNLQVINSMTQEQMQSLKDSSGKIPSLANQLIMTDEEDMNLSQLKTEVVYDGSSLDTNLNWGYDRLYPSLGTFSKDLSKYDRLLITVMCDSRRFTFFADIISSSVYTGGGVFPRADGVQCYECGVTVSSSSFAVALIGYTSGSGFTNRDGSGGYGVVKIEGILKEPAMIYTGKELFNDPVSAGVTRAGQHDTVSEYYVTSDGNTWYRKWASGWKECGGKIAKNVSGRHKVAFPLEFSNTKFTLLKTLNWQSSEAVINGAYFGFQDITESYAYTYSYTPDGYDESWYACGF